MFCCIDSFPYFPYTLDYDLSKMGLNSYPKARLTNASIKGSNIIRSTKTTAKTPSVVFTTESDELKTELENVQALPESSSSISLETESILNRPESKTKFRSVSQQTSILFTDLLTTSVIEASAPTIPFTVSTTSELIEASNFTTETVGSATTLNEEDSDSHIPDTCSDDD